MILSVHLPILSVVNLLIFTFLMPLFGRWKKYLCVPATIFALGLSFIMSIVIMIKIWTEGPFTYHLGGWPPPWGIEFYIDYLSSYMLFILTGISLLIIIFGVKSLDYELKENVLEWYYALYLVLVASMMGLALTNDLFNMFVFVEISAIAACAIISIKETRECVEASFNYLVLSANGSGCILLSIAMIYMITGHLNFSYVSEALPQAANLYPNIFLVALGLLIVGLSVKSALFPLHVWLPDAHSSAPSPSSAILSGLVIKIYIIILIKILFRVFPIDIYFSIPVMDILLWLSTLAILAGSFFAIIQEDIKRMLAYSSISQIGYILMGISLFSQNAMIGGLFHIFSHAVVKSMLFLSAGLIIYVTGLRRIEDLKGIGLRMPITMSAFTIGAASMVGIPITSGFISKWYLAWGALDIGRPFYVAVVLLGSLLNGIYYFPIVINAFFGERSETFLELKKAPLAMLVPIILLALVILFLGIYPFPLIRFLEKAVVFLL